MRDAEIEGPPHDRPARLERVDAAEVLPQAERDRGQHETAAATPVEAHLVVAIVRGDVRSSDPSSPRRWPLGPNLADRAGRGSASVAAELPSRTIVSMEERPLGGSGIAITRIVLGCGSSAGSDRLPLCSGRGRRRTRRSGSWTPPGITGSPPSTRPTRTAAGAARASSASGSRRRARRSATGS